jgi:hypothetical protein
VIIPRFGTETGDDHCVAWKIQIGGPQMTKPKIELWDGIGLGAIVSFPTGILYSNQTGGTSCLHPELEGAYIPLDAKAGEELYAYFEGPKHRGTGATHGLDAEDAAFIEMLLAQRHLSSFVSLDRSRLQESHEAWVWATIPGDGGDDAQCTIFAALGPYPRVAVLTTGSTSVFGWFPRGPPPTSCDWYQVLPHCW